VKQLDAGLSRLAQLIEGREWAGVWSQIEGDHASAWLRSVKPAEREELAQSLEAARQLRAAIEKFNGQQKKGNR
jgi:predicted metal-dependent phosphoesterase TrpH